MTVHLTSCHNPYFLSVDNRPCSVLAEVTYLHFLILIASLQPPADCRAFNKFFSSRLYWKSRRLGRRAPKARDSRGVLGHASAEKILKPRHSEMPFPAFSEGYFRLKRQRKRVMSDETYG